MISGITQGTPSNILFGAGVYFAGVTYSETSAPTEEAIKAAVIGATSGGGKMQIIPEFFAPEIDGVRVQLRELQNKVGEKSTMDASFVELTSDHMAKAVIGNVEAAGEYDVVTSSEVIATGHFYDGFGFFGKLMDGRPVIVLYKQALCTSGFSADSKNKTNSVFTGTFECMGDIATGVQKLPYAIFIRKRDGWQPATAQEVTTE